MEIHAVIVKMSNPARVARSNAAPNIYLPVPNTELFKKSVYYRVATLWNSLPTNI